MQLFARSALRPLSRASVARFSTRYALHTTTRLKTIAEIITDNRRQPESIGIDWSAHAASSTSSRRRFNPTDLASCLAPRPELARSPLAYDPLRFQFDFDEGAGRTSGNPLVGTVDRLLSEEECARLIGFSTSQGYQVAKETIGHGRNTVIDINKLSLSGRVVIESQHFADLLWERLAPLLPPVSPSGWGATWEPVGLNEHFRFLRYGQGDYFKLHRDGGYVREETDPRYGECSFQTLLIYLDSPSEGGETFFSLLAGPHLDKANQVGIVSIRPGRALCFEHNLEHGSAEIREGVKHVMRTDVMYRPLPGTPLPAWLKAKRRYMT